MNLASGDDLYISGFSDRMDSVSIAKTMISEDHGLGATGKAEIRVSPHTTTRKGSPTSSNSRGQGQAIEVDFYRNPTMLSRMILYNKFSNANKRVRDHPQEAMVWVCSKRKTNATQKSQIHSIFDRSHSTTSLTSRTHQQQQYSSNQQHSDYSLRQLPIHIACSCLAFTHDSVLRSELEQLIVRLVVTYPEGCAEFDHSGRRPLHEALFSAATAETISMLLMADPKSIDQRDKFGRTPIELCNRLQGGPKEDIKALLDLGVQYWERARDEAKLRMKMAVVPPSGASVSSSIVAGSSQAEKETLVTTASTNMPTKKQQQNQIESEEITPIAWEQLERRVILLEQLLAEMYEKNYELAGAVEQLKKAKQALTVKLEIARTQPSSLRQRGSWHSRGGGSLKSASRSIETLSVDTIPEDDEESIAEMIDQVESVVGSYHSSKYQPTTAGGSGVSEISSFSSHTGGQGDSVIPCPPDFARSESLVSGLTEASFFDASIYAVRDPANTSSADSDSRFGTASLLGTDNLNEMFQAAQKTVRKPWSSPVASSTFLPSGGHQHTTTPMVVEEEEEEFALGGDAAMEVDRSAGTETSDMRIPDNSTLATDEYDSSHTGRVSPGADEASRETMSTRARVIENRVFGGTEEDDTSESESTSAPDPTRYNYDIRIPALDWA
ncbi:expressed unknown protein [Seminavis robusta]|uniref:Uncharacterized protein n=1 Tax=Seminavis robusta TaxID=568900 RepID=A0A9N8E199_9STRA|nr:expressed unknown protein [Seminavis robusta]|eukprot:Sro518_g158870.1 n/a (668) ;mRNA; f:45738-47828